MDETSTTTTTGLNSALQDEDHPIPVPEDIFATLNGGRFFSTVDLKDAYLQVKLTEESKELCTINTHRGLYQYQRLAFGLKTAPMVFQRIMDKMISGLDGVTAYLDDIIIVGSTEKEHKENLFKLFSRITEYGFRVKLEKCRFLEEEIKFLGFIVDKNGRRPDEEKIRAIKNMDTPKGEKELRSFMGMITYYGSFIPQMKALRGPLDVLLGKDVDWKWTSVEEKLFQKLKDTLTSDLNLTHYQPTLPLIVAADACDYGIGAVISHRMPDGTEKPIAHAAKSLNAAEKNYSQIEKEGLGLIFAVKKFHKYLYGRKFLLRTDHKPLLSIFGSKKGIPVHSQNRLVRWSTILLAYDFDIEYIKTDDFGQADALSRMIQKIPTEDEDIVIAQVELDVEGSLQSAVRKLPINVVDVQEETRKDKLLKKVIKLVSKGPWPKKVDESLKQFNSIKDSLAVVQECLMFGDRVVVPYSLQRAVLKQLHEGHPGMVRMKQLARSFVYWPMMDDDVEKVVARCNTCQVHGKTPRKVPLVPWETPERVWQRVHVDYAGPDNGQYYLVAVDAKSKWAEVKIVKSITAMSTVRTLKEIFSHNGFPETIVSDNGTQFVSKEFSTMCQESGIVHIRSPAFHPQSNGQAERFVDTLKRGLKKLRGEGSVSNETLSEFLLHYRSTPSTALSGLSPAEVHLNRRIRTKMSVMMPQLNKRSEGSQNYPMKKQFDKHHGVRARAYTKGDEVFTKVFEKNAWSWKPATLFSALPVFINQCSYNLLRVYFETVRDGHRSALFLPGENENKNGLVSHSQFLFSSDENCVIVHASESTLDVRLELKMKQKWPQCKVVKVGSQAAPDENNQIEVVPAKLKLTFERQNARKDRYSVDLDTLMRVVLNSRYIEALYLDEFVSVDELFQFSEQKDFAKLFPVCQLTMVIPKPKNKSDETKFWNFILYFVVDSPLVLVSSRVVNQDKIDLVFYNPEYKTCNFKHFSIPFSKEGVKF
ncbi:hypothetical protein B9Z55_020036 [Caenorhabditis nigoni]|uniref:RNA-directed DNA polymerase n=1 Tax=Caenorhabditis nigoni TaxID=1611254 RepID=A0A2G5TKY7_9PELO|nr:hypothetical protein B9Z55_020036 [Caenorhabditis nigoni]